MRPICLCLMILTLVAVPALAQFPSTPACGAATVGGAPPTKAFTGDLAHQPLAPEQRLFYWFDGLVQESPFEVRYLVEGKPHLTEIVELAAPQLRSPKSKTALELEALVAEERVIELLALRPDLVRQLRQFAKKDNVSLEVQVYQEGLLVELLSFRELHQRSQELGSGSAVSLVVQSTVSGPGDRGGDKLRSVVAFEYLDDCGDCTTSTPCDTECGYDPGKGGPVTCGEYGVCDYVPSCSCSSVLSEYWGPWYLYRTYYQAACLRSFTSPTGSAQHYRYVEEYRRDRYRRTKICPNCPSCDGCYEQVQLIGYQLDPAYGCWYEGAELCYNGATPYCCTLCFAGPLTPCYSC